MRRWRIVGGVFVVLALTSAVIYTLRSSVLPELPSSPLLTTPSVTDKTVLGATAGLAPENQSRPAGMVGPVPTNRWWSSGILEQWPAPLFAWPQVTRLTPEGAWLSVPTRKVVAQTVASVLTEEIRVAPREGTHLTRAVAHEWGDWHVTFRVLAETQPVFDVTATPGSPFVFITAHQSQLIVAFPTDSRVSTRSCTGKCGSVVIVETPESVRALVLPRSARFTPRTSHLADISFASARPMFTVVAIAPNSALEDYLPYALQPIQNTRVTFSVKREEVETHFNYTRPTLMGVFPHQALYATPPLGKMIGQYETLRGNISIYAGSAFSTVVPRPPVIPGLPVAPQLTSEAHFSAQLGNDLAVLTPEALSIYDSGKDMLRTAQLLELAEQGGNDEIRTVARQRLRAALVDWCTAGTEADQHYFVYDIYRGGLIGLPPAFGSDHYNDHHFHAGYFIHAAAILARYDTSFVSEYGDCIDLLIQDVAAPDRDNQYFPWLRHFDPYAGHSWANGLTLLADGNNQESTSEAIHAWWAIALWGRTVGDETLHELGVWLMSQETVSAQVYWLNTAPQFKVVPPDFPYPMISILWGGKADYTTFFSPDPRAIHGIQFFPVTPALLGVIDSQVIERLITPWLSGDSASTWQTNARLVAALALRDAAASLPLSGSLDPVYSRSYTTHWLTALAELGQAVPVHDIVAECGAVFVEQGAMKLVAYRFQNEPSGCVVRNMLTRQVINITPLEVGWNIRPIVW